MKKQASHQIVTTFASNVKAARKAKGLTQRQLGDKVGVDTLTISRWERGAVRPTIANLAALCKALDRDMAWFHTQTTEEEAA